MSILLITRHMALNEIRWKWLRDALPDIEMVFCKDTDPTPEQLARADFILGRPDPAALKHCKNLKLLQLWSAGADRYFHGKVPEGDLATSGNSQGQAVSEHMLAMLLAMVDGIKNKIEPGEPLDRDIYEMSAVELEQTRKTPGSLEEALQALKEDHAFLLAGNVFTEDLIETWIDYKTDNEVEPLKLRPHPYEFYLYYDN